MLERDGRTNGRAEFLYQRAIEKYTKIVNNFVSLNEHNSSEMMPRFNF